MDANLQEKNTDTLTLVEFISTSTEVLKFESFEPTQKILIEWFGELEARIGVTTDEAQLQKLDQWQKRLRIIARCIDRQADTLQIIKRQFTGIDQAYWTQAIKGQELTEEIQNLQNQVTCLTRGWRAERNYHRGKGKNSNRLKVA